MRTEIKDDGTIQVTVSRRNLLSLLAKLDGYPEWSVCTIAGPKIYPATRLTAEEDEVHYRHPSRLGIPAGPMISETEERLP